MYRAKHVSCYDFFLPVYETKKELAKTQHIMAFILFVEK
tara:strand:- start:848 stop:964 length:117 start_codon:yes stop_codon:yes gene_type:complete